MRVDFFRKRFERGIIAHQALDQFRKLQLHSRAPSIIVRIPECVSVQLQKIAGEEPCGPFVPLFERMSLAHPVYQVRGQDRETCQPSNVESVLRAVYAGFQRRNIADEMVFRGSFKDALIDPCRVIKRHPHGFCRHLAR